MHHEHIVILCTVGSEEEGVKIASSLVEEGLVACVNMVPKIRSIYVWKGEVCDDTEHLLVIKSKPSVFEKVEARIVELHSYDVPEVIALPIEQGHKPYLDWIDSLVGR